MRIISVETLDQLVGDRDRWQARCLAREHELIEPRAHPEYLEGLDAVRRAMLAEATRILQREFRPLGNSRSWRLAGPARNLMRSLRGQGKEAQSIVHPQGEAPETTSTIRQSLSWDLTAPLRLAKLALAKFLRSTRDGAGEYDLSPLFDSGWYLSKYPEVAASGVNPLAHYIAYGAAEGRDPGPLFDTDWYLSKYSDVAVSRVNPLAHYVVHGASEGRDPGPLFNTDWYLSKYPDVAASGVNPLAHYIAYGASEGREPGPSFRRTVMPGPRNKPGRRAAMMNQLKHRWSRLGQWSRRRRGKKSPA